MGAERHFESGIDEISVLLNMSYVGEGITENIS